MRASVPTAISAMLIVAIMNTGCLLASEGRIMEADIKALRAQLDAVKKSSDEEREALRKKNAEVEEGLSSLNNSARRNDTDLGTQLDTLQKSVQELAGNLEEVRYKLDRLERTPVAVTDAPTSAPAAAVAATTPPATAMPDAKQTLPTNKHEAVVLVQKLLKDKDERKRDDGKRLANELVTKYPKEEGITDVVRLSLGDRYADDKMHQKAILEYKKVFDTFKKGSRADTAMYKIAQTMLTMGYQDDARVWFEELLKAYPRSELVKDTKVRLAELDKQKTAKKKK